MKRLICQSVSLWTLVVQTHDAFPGMFCSQLVGAGKFGLLKGALCVVQKILPVDSWARTQQAVCFIIILTSDTERWMATWSFKWYSDTFTASLWRAFAGIYAQVGISDYIYWLLNGLGKALNVKDQGSYSENGVPKMLAGFLLQSIAYNIANRVRWCESRSVQSIAMESLQWFWVTNVKFENFPVKRSTFCSVKSLESRAQWEGWIKRNTC